MARIPEEEIERIKRETDLAALVRSRGVELHKHGSKDFAGKCPFHQDDQPSFIVSPEKGLFHCMGCGAAGNCIQFVEKFDGVSFRHAFEILDAGKAAFSLAESEPANGSRSPPCRGSNCDVPVEAVAKRRTLNSCARWWTTTTSGLLKTPAALDYLRGARALPRGGASNASGSGFADRTLGLRLPDMNRKDGEAIRTRLAEAGLYPRERPRAL